MKKMKLLMPLLGLTATAGLVLPAAVSCGNGQSSSTYDVEITEVDGATVEIISKDTGKDLTFKVKADTGYVVTKVTVKIGDGAEQEVKEVDGVYTVAKDTITGKVVITPTVVKAAGKINAKVNEDYASGAGVELIALQADSTEIGEDIQVGDILNIKTVAAEESQGAHPEYFVPYIPLTTTGEVVDGTVLLSYGDGEKLQLVYGVDYYFLHGETLNDINFMVNSLAKFHEGGDIEKPFLPKMVLNFSLGLQEIAMHIEHEEVYGATLPADLQITAGVENMATAESEYKKCFGTVDGGGILNITPSEVLTMTAAIEDDDLTMFIRIRSASSTEGQLYVDIDPNVGPYIYADGTILSYLNGQIVVGPGIEPVGTDLVI